MIQRHYPAGIRPLRARTERKSILYVEDNDDNWEVARLWLNRRFRLQRAKTSKEACQIVAGEAGQLSAILMDIELRGSELDGIQLTRLMRGTLDREGLPDYTLEVPVLDVPILFVTGYAERYSEADLIAVGGSRRITKPVRFGELSIALETVDVARLSTLAIDIVRGETSGADLAERALADPEFAPRMTALLESRLLGESSAGDATTLKNAALAIVLANLLPRDAAPVARVCLRRATAATRLASALCPERRADAFGLGILLDAGLILRARYDLEGARELASLPAGARVVWERARGEEVHPRRGSFLAGDWGFARDICEAVAQHHDLSRATTPLARVAALAELVAAVFEGGNAQAALDAAVEGMRNAGLEPETAQRILSELPDDLVLAADALGINVGAPDPQLSDLLDATSQRIELDRCYRQTLTTLDEIGREHHRMIERQEQANASLTQSREETVASLAEVQALFVPARTEHTDNGLSVAAFCRPAGPVGGDLWSYEAGQLLVGDVTGHGIHAAIVAASVASQYRLLHRSQSSLGTILERLNEEVRATTNGCYTVALTAVEIDRENLLMRSWHGGAPPLLVSRGGDVEEVIERGSQLGAVRDGWRIGYRERRLTPGERILVFTDGVVENETLRGPIGRAFLRQQLQETTGLDCQAARQVIVANLDDCAQVQADDMTFVLMDVLA